jgi:hypothetical protein
MKNLLTTLSLAMMLLASPISAKEQAAPVQQHNSNAVWFENWIGLSNSTMTVAAPSGEAITIFAEKGTPVFQLEGNEVQDGLYRYELSAATEEKVKTVNKQNNGRGEGSNDDHSKPFYMSGYFTVSRGVIVTPKDIKEE